VLQEISLLDVRKEITFCKKTGINVLGVVENMSGFVCPCCKVCLLTRMLSLLLIGAQHQSHVPVWCVAHTNKQSAEIKPLCCVQTKSEIFVSDAGGAAAMAAEMGVPFLGSIPLDPQLLRCCEKGQSYFTTCPDGAAVPAFTKVVESTLSQI